MNEYERRQEEKRERLEEAANRAESRAASAGNTASGILRHIPPGQPILVGHHSERRHRRDLKRVDNALRRAHEQSERAKELRSRAAAVGTGGISSDDPDAVTKLRVKLDNLERDQRTGKAINAAWRKAGKPAPDAGREVWQRVADAVGMSDNDMGKIRLRMARQPYHEQPFPAYWLQNLSANIRRVRQRIEQLSTRDDLAPRPAIECPEGVTVEEDRDENRVAIYFPGKPSDETRANLKSFGFRWNRRMGAWTRHLNNGAWHAAQAVIRTLIEREGK